MKVMPNASIGQGFGLCSPFGFTVVKLTASVFFTGMTETATVVSIWPLSQHIGTHGGAGQLLPGNVARVMKEDGSLADYEEEGELHVKGPSVVLRYINNDEA